MIDCIIIGAGISGLLAGKILQDARLEVVILEKSRGVGGRMATRRVDEAVCDHGAQFFTVRDPRFEAWVDRWRDEGLVEEWYERTGSGKHYRGAPSMTGIAKHLVLDLDVRRQVQVQSSSFDGHWKVDVGDGEILESRTLLLTAPMPQSLAILDAGDVTLPTEARAALDSIHYHRCIVAMAILNQPSAITENEGALKLDGEPLQWISDNQRKGISAKVPSVTIHSTPAFAEKFWDAPNEERIPLLIEAATPHLEADVISWQGHRWGFSQPTSSYSEEAFVDGDLRLAIAGDGLVGGRVEGAALSGIVAAEKIKLMR